MVHSNCISDERKQRSVTINDLQTSYHRRTGSVAKFSKKSILV